MTLSVLLAGAAVQAVPASPLGRAGAAANSTTFQDSTGEEAPTAPDISTVAVSNDDAGLLSFAISFTNRPALGPGEELSLWFDTDGNPSTGLLGWDRFIELVDGDLVLIDWESYDSVPAATLSFVQGPSTVTFRVGAKDLGVTNTVRFHVWADARPEDEDVSDVDVAPDAFFVGWTYEVKVAPPELTLTTLTCAPQAPRAGALVTTRSRASLMRGGVPEALPQNRSVAWAAWVGASSLKPRATARSADGTLTATWRLPQTARGKLLRVRLVVTAENLTTTRSASCRVR